MPFTLSHIAAVLPAKRLCPKFLSLPALAVGSVAPDLAYVFNVYAVAGLSHSMFGAVAFCVPVGAVILVVMYLLAPGYERLLRLPEGALAVPGSLVGAVRARGLIYAVSIALGAVTHDVWDSFTHKGGYWVQQAPDAFAAKVAVGPFSLAVFKILQYGSGVIGGVVVAVYAVCWYRAALQRASVERGFVLGAIGFVVVCALVAGLVTWLSMGGVARERVAFVFAVNCMRVFFAGTAMLAAWHRWRDKC